jgi:hypothetical protein
MLIGYLLSRPQTWFSEAAAKDPLGPEIQAFLKETLREILKEDANAQVAKRKSSRSSKAGNSRAAEKDPKRATGTKKRKSNRN